LGSRVDRHQHIGDGDIGKSAFKFLVNDERFENHPAVVETPELDSGDRSFAMNIKRLRSLRD
jgi:deoxyribonuclease-4